MTVEIPMTARGRALAVAERIGSSQPPSVAELQEAAVILEPCSHLSEAMLAAHADIVAALDAYQGGVR